MKKLLPGEINEIGMQHNHIDKENISLLSIHKLNDDYTIEDIPEKIMFFIKRDDGSIDMLTNVSVKSQTGPIDINEGEIFDIESPYIEGDICNIYGNLKITESGFKIDLDFTQFGSAFIRHCESAFIDGEYKDLVK